jgi:hypothetical protein
MLEKMIRRSRGLGLVDPVVIRIELSIGVLKQLFGKLAMGHRGLGQPSGMRVGYGEPMQFSRVFGTIPARQWDRDLLYSVGAENVRSWLN